MNLQESQHLNELLKKHKKRLYILESQAASFGISTPPHILMEIDDIREKISSIDEQLIVTKEFKSSNFANTFSVLFLSADPTDASRLRLSEELREIQEQLKLAKLRDRFTLEQRMSVRPADISQALLDIQP